jgi:hypothetical protein
MGGGGKTEIDALARASGHRPPHGVVYFGLGNERAKPLAFLPNRNSAVRRSKRRASGSPTSAPSHGATPTGDVSASRAHDKAVAPEVQRRNRSDSASGAHPARREARAPAGQPENIAPSGARSAGQSATLTPPAQHLPLPIVTPMAETTGSVRAAHRAGCPKGSAYSTSNSSARRSNSALVSAQFGSYFESKA